MFLISPAIPNEFKTRVVSVVVIAVSPQSFKVYLALGFTVPLSITVPNISDIVSSRVSPATVLLLCLKLLVLIDLLNSTPLLLNLH